MLERGLLPDFSAEALAELDRLQGPAVDPIEPVRELGELLCGHPSTTTTRLTLTS